MERINDRLTKIVVAAKERCYASFSAHAQENSSLQVVFKESVRDGYELLVCSIFAHTNAFRLIWVYRTLYSIADHQFDLAVKSYEWFLCFGHSMHSSGWLMHFDGMHLSTYWSIKHHYYAKVRDFAVTHGFLPYVKSATRGNAILYLLFCNESLLVRNVIVRIILSPRPTWALNTCRSELPRLTLKMLSCVICLLRIGLEVLARSRQ